jgi:hypothetical protein
MRRTAKVHVNDRRIPDLAHGGRVTSVVTSRRNVSDRSFLEYMKNPICMTLPGKVTAQFHSEIEIGVATYSIIFT